MSYLDIAALDAMPVKSEPYDYLVVPHFIKAERFRDVFINPTPARIPPPSCRCAATSRRSSTS